MLIYLIHTTAFQSMIVVLGWIMFFLLTVAAIVLAAAGIILAIIRFLRRYWKTLVTVSVVLVGLGIAILLFVPITL